MATGANRTVALLIIAIAALAGCTSSADNASPSATRASDPSIAGPSTAGRSIAVPSTAGVSSAGLSSADWPMYHGSPDRSGRSTSMPAANGPLQLIHSFTLDGEVLASPLIVHGLTILATENDSVYAFDSKFQPVWRRSLGSPSPAQERLCGNIDPLGITGTPIYDPGTGSIYLVAEHGGAVRHELYALDSTTGAVRWSRSVDLPGVSAKDMQQRGALAIAHGRVWVSFGAQAGDCGDYKGRVVAVALDGRGAPVFYSPPTVRGGGIWNPNGPTIDADGNVLVVSANGAAFPGEAYDHTNSVLRLDASARLLDSFAPSDWAQNNQGDVGLGSQGVSLVGSKWIVLGGKSGPVYVLRQSALGGIGGQVDMQEICRSFGGAAVEADDVYLPCTDGVRAVRVDDTGHLHVRWHAASSITGSPVLGGGRIWVMDTRGGVLHSLDPETGRSVAQIAVGEANRFATPAVSGPDVVIPTLAGAVVVRTS